MHKAVLTSTLVLLPLLVVAAAVAQPPAKIPGASGTVFAVERFDFGQNTLAAFDASTGVIEAMVSSPRLRVTSQRTFCSSPPRQRSRSTRTARGRTRT